MTRVLAAALIFGLAAGGEEAPPPPAVNPAPITAAPEVKAPEATKPDPSKALAARVKEALEGDSKVHAVGIDVTASGGVVALWGTVADAEERRRAAQVASSVEGVKSVDNKLAIVKGS